MSGDVLRYRAGARHADLGEDECVIRAWPEAPYPHAGRLGLLTFCFRRKNDGKLERRQLPVTLNGPPESSPTTWGLNRTGRRQWQITPSILCWDHTPDGGRVDVWHETPRIVGVPDSEPWTTSDCECR